MLATLEPYNPGLGPENKMLSFDHQLFLVQEHHIILKIAGILGADLATVWLNRMNV